MPDKEGLPLSPKADMCSALAHVRFVPKADITEQKKTPPLKGGGVQSDARRYGLLFTIRVAYRNGGLETRSSPFRYSRWEID